MDFMNVDGWKASADIDAHNLKRVVPRWIPQDASLEISHAIRKKGALTGNNCHGPNGVLGWKVSGYTDEEAAALRDIGLPSDHGN